MFCESLESRTLLASYTPPASPRAEIDLSPSWRFVRSNKAGAETIAYNDSGWSSVSLPHTWNAKDGQDGNFDYYRGTGWYRKKFTIPTTYSGKQFYLRFGAAAMSADVYVNGIMVGSHKGGYSAFIFDINPYVKVGKTTTLAVKVNNSEDTTISPYYEDYAPDWTKFGGLYRDAKIVVTDALQISPQNAASPGVFARQSNVSSASADLSITTEIRNSGGKDRKATVTTTLVDASGNLVKQVSSANVSVIRHKSAGVVQTMTISKPHLWNGVKDPYQYKLYTVMTDASGTRDVLIQSIGFRYFKLDANQGFLLNGKKYDLHGVSFHQDRLDKGSATSQSDRTQDMNYAIEMGATAVRLAHYQFADDIYNYADKKGLIVWGSVPLDANFNSSAAFNDNLQNQLKETIRQLYNHPSIFFWGVGNEMGSTDADRAIVKSLHDLAKKEDPGRLTITANNLENDKESLKFASDIDGFNKYWGWYGTLPARTISTWLDTMHTTYPTLPIFLSEFGAGGSIFHHTDTPTKPSPIRSPLHPEEYQNLVHETYMAAIKARPWIAAAFPWALTDFASDWRGEGDQIGRNDKGLITYDRKTKKDSFFLYKANWSSSPVMYITDRRFTDRTNAITEIKMYSNCDSVTLSVNGQTIGTTTPDAIDIAKFANVTLQAGKNTISVSGTKGGKTYTDSCTWTLTSPQARVASAGASGVFSMTQVQEKSVADELLI